MSAGKRLRILTWHVHGNYLFYLSQIPHDIYVPAKPGYPPGYAGRAGRLPWGDNVHEIACEAVRDTPFDCVLFQSRAHYLEDQYQLLSAAQQKLPRIYLEHDPPQEHPTNTRHPAQDPDLLLVHVTPFNALMWDSGLTPTRVIEHGVLPANVHYSGELEEGIVVVNNLRKRGRRLGADVYETMRRTVPLSLVGMDAQSMPGGAGEVNNLELAAHMARYRFFFNPIRYTSLGLAVVEAMMIGMPVVGLATTELATVIRSGENGYVDTDLGRLADTMGRLLKDPALAQEWGQRGRASARERFNIQRFVADWNAALRLVTS
jgi:glycosyltransferase involved in cell wall biosynthesis